MIRKAFKMQVHNGKAVEYERRHNPIWPEMEQLLKDHGVSNYSIFIDDETNTLFAYVELESKKEWDAIAHDPVCRRWWDSLNDLMKTEFTNRPWQGGLREVFHMD